MVGLNRRPAGPPGTTRCRPRPTMRPPAIHRRPPGNVARPPGSGCRKGRRTGGSGSRASGAEAYGRSTVGVRFPPGVEWELITFAPHHPRAERVQAGSSESRAKRASSPEGAMSVAVSPPIQRTDMGARLKRSDSSTRAGNPMARRIGRASSRAKKWPRADSAWRRPRCRGYRSGFARPRWHGSSGAASCTPPEGEKTRHELPLRLGCRGDHGAIPGSIWGAAVSQPQ